MSRPEWDLKNNNLFIFFGVWLGGGGSWLSHCWWLSLVHTVIEICHSHTQVVRFYYDTTCVIKSLYHEWVTQDIIFHMCINQYHFKTQYYGNIVTYDDFNEWHKVTYWLCLTTTSTIVTIQTKIYWLWWILKSIGNCNNWHLSLIQMYGVH